MKDDQFKELLETMTAGLNTVKPEATFARALGKSSIEEVIDYLTATGLKCW